MTAEDVAIVVVAAGSSLRFGSDKLAVSLAGRTVLEHAVDSLRNVFPGSPTVLVVREAEVEDAARSWSAGGVRVVAGGRRRQDSVRNGCELLDPGDDTVVLIHDGARPFVPRADVEAVVAGAAETGAALLVAPLSETVKRLRSDGMVASTVPREGLARALTPQAFRAAVLRRAWAEAGDAAWTDEAALVERGGGDVKAVQGDPRNLKVTSPEDIAALQSLFSRGIRVGQGFDVHPFASDHRLWLCGVEIPDGPGLAGHSDADVALHALTDAILGAAGAGDIGQHFPPSDEQWRGAASERFLRRALDLAAAAGLRVVHCDLTLLAERPRIEPHRERMRAHVAELLGVRSDQVNLKATTCEGLGFVGRGEGMAALAVATLEARSP
jgi:2-C-methyl-D-erythritol 4-phosphate cytidylyltransferase / 2-C-methyl-D-erythritol 2,4-cyclodiphosphate synthase